MPKFKTGDKVVFTNPAKHVEHPKWFPTVGTVGVVTRADDFGVLFVKWREGTTSLDDLWTCTERDVAPVKPDHAKQKIIIMIDKDDPMKVVATDLLTRKTGISRCHPDDAFDFHMGAWFALNRLVFSEDNAELQPEEQREPKCKFKVGDIIIGNEKANKYGVTRQGWVGRVIRVFDKPISGRGVDIGVDRWFEAENVNTDAKGTFKFVLDQDAFDLA